VHESSSQERPYHHGNLRPALLEQARRTVREKGAQALSLRELARDVGVSHAAPRRHFADRQALLEALAVWGFEALGAELQAAEHAGEDFQTRLRALAAAYIRFATREAAMLELMFASKREDHDGQLGGAADNAFGVMLDLIGQGQEERILPPGEPERVGLVLFATIQGIAAMLTAGIVGEEQLEDLVEDATENFVRGCRAQLEEQSPPTRSRGPTRARRRTPA
jgi:AcrR family transcriptional regulator